MKNDLFEGGGTLPDWGMEYLTKKGGPRALFTKHLANKDENGAVLSNFHSKFYLHSLNVFGLTFHIWTIYYLLLNRVKEHPNLWRRAKLVCNFYTANDSSENK